MIIGIESSRANRKEKTGTEWYAHSLIRHLCALDQKDAFVLYTDSSLEPSLASIGPNVKERILRWPPKRFWNQIRLSVEMLVRSPDVLFLPAHTLPIIHPRRTVTTIHDVGFERFPELYRPKERMYHRWAVRYALRHAYRIITPSVFTKEEILEWYPEARHRENDIVVVHHGYDHSSLHRKSAPATTTTILARYRIRTPYIFYIGRIQNKKNISRLVNAFSIFCQKNSRANHLLVLSGHPEYGHEHVKYIIEREGLKDRVLLTGYVPLLDAQELLRNAVVFAFPSLYEGFGLPILDAQACETVVCASGTSSLPEVGGEGALYVDPKNVNDIANGLERCVFDHSLRQRLRQKGLENVKRFDWDVCAKRTLHVLKA
jgi:glycosyltransferase involved in cell wall biosynthesis